MTITCTCRIAILLALLAAASCGGSTSAPPAPTVPGATTLDAEYPTSANAVGGQTAGDRMHLGEYWTNTDLESRCAFLFDLRSLPPGSVVTQATLALYVTGIEGAPAGLLPIVVDHDGRPAITPPQGGDFDLPYDDMGLAQLNAPGSQPMMPDQWNVDVTTVVRAAWGAGAASSVFRLRATTAPIVNGNIDSYRVGGIWPTDTQVWGPTLHIEYLAP